MTSEPAGLEDRLGTGLRGGEVEDLEHRPNSTFPWSKKGRDGPGDRKWAGGSRAEVWHSQLCQPWVPTVLSGVDVVGSQLLVRQKQGWSFEALLSWPCTGSKGGRWACHSPSTHPRTRLQPGTPGTPGHPWNVALTPWQAAQLALVGVPGAAESTREGTRAVSSGLYPLCTQFLLGIHTTP